MDPAFLALAIIILLFSVILHEVMHGWVALKFGDRTAQNMGRLTLNPLPHIDLIGTILLPMILIFSGSPILFGWAKPVPVNPLNFRSIRKGELFVSAAGVAANFTLAILAAIAFHLFKSFTPLLLQEALRFMVYINLILAVFNCLPIPPLDGSKIIMSSLPPRMETQYRQFEKYGIFILLILLLVPVGNSSLLGIFLSLFLDIFRAILRV